MTPPVHCGNSPALTALSFRMAMTQGYEAVEPTRADVDARPTPVVLEFGTPWCGYCRAAQPLIAEALERHPDLAHLKIEDGKGRPLGRSFRVKLWPTVIFLKDGIEVDRVVRPLRADEVRPGLSQIA